MKIICLLSGGIDSPVAAAIMQEKGCEIILLHFYHTAQPHKKIFELAKTLAKKTNKPLALYIVPFKDLQMEIIKTVKPEIRMIVYRRTMLKIAEKILEKTKAEGFVTGDSLGQVASQTLDNLNCIYSATKKPILTPLIGMDKVEIMKKAEQIGTYATSIIPHEDCCSYFIAQHPTTHARLKDIENAEQKINFEPLIEKAVKSLQCHVIECN